MAFGGYVQNDIAKILDNIASVAPSAEVSVVRMLSEWKLSLPQIKFCWRLTENRTMLPLDVRFVQTDL
jgi:hypothetical protein